jgi:hypothetical protein
MRHWKFRKALFHLTVVLVMVFSLALLGCGDDDDLTAADLAGRTFNLADCSVIDPALAGQACTITFGAAAGNTVPFTLTIGANTITGTATVNTIEFEITAITVGGVAQDSVTIDGVTFTVGDTFTLDTAKSESGGDVTIVLTNPETGDDATFVFQSGGSTSTGTTGSSGS